MLLHQCTAFSELCCPHSNIIICEINLWPGSGNWSGFKKASLKISVLWHCCFLKPELFLDLAHSMNCKWVDIAEGRVYGAQGQVCVLWAQVADANNISSNHCLIFVWEEKDGWVGRNELTDYWFFYPLLKRKSVLIRIYGLQIILLLSSHISGTKTM